MVLPLGGVWAEILSVFELDLPKKDIMMGRARTGISPEPVVE